MSQEKHHWGKVYHDYVKYSPLPRGGNCPRDCDSHMDDEPPRDGYLSWDHNHPWIMTIIVLGMVTILGMVIVIGMLTII